MTRRNASVPSVLAFPGSDGGMLTIGQTAAVIGVEHKTIRRLVDRGELRAYRLGNTRVIRIDPADVAALMGEVNPAGRALLGGDAA